VTALACPVCSYADEHGAWPPAHRGTHCRACHRSWTGLKEAHCVVCCAHFSTDNHAQSHRGPHGTCLDPAGVLRNDTQPRLRLVDRGSGPVWVGADPMPVRPRWAS
jgi:hypothetical protein